MHVLQRVFRSFSAFSCAVLFAGLVSGVAQAEEPKSDDVPTTTLPVTTKPIFTELDIRRPIVITHAGDGTNRLFIASQYGVIYVMPNDPDVEEAEIFMDMEELVSYKDRENEEGFLGLAFHPKFEENGEFFVFYTTSKAPHTSIISRFTTKGDSHSRGDVASEEILLTLPQKYWNHNGGTLAFGPDGYLYIGLGDGGSANDPEGNGQNLQTLNGSILRIDIDNREGDKPYAIPDDNPFVGRDDARPEIFAYGLRNVWRLSFDRATGHLWAADVGQNIWEEINLIEKGGNYGWNLREGKHPFGENGSGPREDLIEPIWEYHHDIGKSITGGVVYRGEQVPELQGVYLFADYVTMKLWGLKYDESAEKVTAHYELKPIYPVTVITFGEDEQGEVYYSNQLGEIFTFEQAK